MHVALVVALFFNNPLKRLLNTLCACKFVLINQLCITLFIIMLRISEVLWYRIFPATFTIMVSMITYYTEIQWLPKRKC